MNTYGQIELRFSRAAVERYGQALDNFAGVGPNHVTAEYFIARPVDDELHHRPFVASGQRVLERLEGSSEEINFNFAPPRLLLG
jgi:hypothetical protein